MLEKQVIVSHYVREMLKRKERNVKEKQATMLEKQVSRLEYLQWAIFSSGI